MKIWSDKKLVARKTKQRFFSVKRHHVNQGFEFTALKDWYLVRGRYYQKNLTSIENVWVLTHFKLLVFFVL